MLEVSEFNIESKWGLLISGFIRFQEYNLLHHIYITYKMFY